MRTLNLNQTTLWVVKSLSYTDEVDSEGDFTGETIPVYDTPSKIRLSLYPNDGSINKNLLGFIEHIDMFAVSTDVILNNHDMLYLTEPVSDFDTTYEYIVGKRLPSINGYRYLLKGRG